MKAFSHRKIKTESKRAKAQKGEKKIGVCVLQSHDDGFGGWAHGTAFVGNVAYQYETKHFKVGSVFGIDGGRVSKLHILTLCVGENEREVCAYDRGWGVRPDMANKTDMAVYNAILKRYN